MLIVLLVKIVLVVLVIIVVPIMVSLVIMVIIVVPIMIVLIMVSLRLAEHKIFNVDHLIVGVNSYDFSLVSAVLSQINNHVPTVIVIVIDRIFIIMSPFIFVFVISILTDFLLVFINLFLDILNSFAFHDFQLPAKVGNLPLYSSDHAI